MTPSDSDFALHDNSLRERAPGPKDAEMVNLRSRPLAFIEQLRKTKAEMLTCSKDPWRLRLERVRGKVAYDGVERISTQDLFDLLEVPQRARTAGACRRLATLMRELGWTPVKARGMTQNGFRDQVRGYAREARAVHNCHPAVAIGR